MAKRGRPRKKETIQWSIPSVLRDPTVQKFQRERNITTGTMKGYAASLQRYLTIHGFESCDEFLQEAREDEKNHIPIKEARITKRLADFKAHLQETLDNDSTIHTYFTKLETFYRHYQITVPKRAPMKINKSYHVEYYDIPSKNMIEIAVTQSTYPFKAIILFMSSSGTGKAETVSLTLGQFLEGLRDYTDETDPEQIIDKLRGRRDLVPLISMVRRKTNVPYYTCCSPEATYHILEHIFMNRVFDKEQLLFGVTDWKLPILFQNMNDNNRWGRVGPYRRFRAHMLRKFHASNIGCPFELINTLEGRTNGMIHETYVKQKPDEIKSQYMEYMHNVMIHPENFIGPHCGDEIQDTHVASRELDLHESNAVDDVSEVTPLNASPMVNTGGLDVTVLQKQILELTKIVGVLEYRIEQLENG